MCREDFLPGNTCIIDEKVDGSQPHADFLRQPLDLIFFLDVAGKSEHRRSDFSNVPGCGLQLADIAGGNDDTVSLACKRTRQSPPQPAAASRHNDNFIAQIRHLRKIPR